MNTCPNCGTEIREFTMVCLHCITILPAAEDRKAKEKKTNRRLARIAKEEAYDSVGMKKVRGMLGGRFWE